MTTWTSFRTAASSAPHRRIVGALASLTLGAAIAVAGCAAPVDPAPQVSPAPTPASSASATPRVTAPGEPTFSWEVRDATAADAATWHDGCPVLLSDLVVVALNYWTFDGAVAEGVLVINRDVVAPAHEAFAALFDQRFAIRRMSNIDEFGGSDDASMAADNTSAFNCRYAVADGEPTWSRHAYGLAIDLNPVENPYVFHGEALPPAGASFVDRAPAPGVLTVGSDALRAFLDAGFSWGGEWSNPDYQHVEIRS